MRLSIVVPAYNEEPRIGATLDAARDYLTSEVLERIGAVEILVVDDGSRDRTVDVVRDRAREFPCPIRLLEEPHRGKGAAVAAGMGAAEGELRFLCDADLAMPFSELDRFLDEHRATGAQVVIGSREIVGAQRLDEPFYRHLRGRVFNGCVKLLAVRGIQDTQCGYKLFTAAAAESIFPRITIQGFGFDVEALFLARRAGFVIHELAIRWHHQPISKVRPVRDAFRMLVDLIQVRWNALSGRYGRAE